MYVIQQISIKTNELLYFNVHLFKHFDIQQIYVLKMYVRIPFYEYTTQHNRTQFEKCMFPFFFKTTTTTKL